MYEYLTLDSSVKTYNKTIIKEKGHYKSMTDTQYNAANEIASCFYAKGLTILDWKEK